MSQRKMFLINVCNFILLNDDKFSLLTNGRKYFFLNEGSNFCPQRYKVFYSIETAN